jgi:hypothetical protein
VAPPRHQNVLINMATAILDQKLDWFVLQEGEYRVQKINDPGIIPSRVFPGLWLAVTALLDGNMVRVLAVVQEGLKSAEHRAFVEQLQQQR